MTTMNEHEFRWPVFLIVGGLLDADLREVPHINATVADAKMVAMRRPCEVQYLVHVSFKCSLLMSCNKIVLSALPVIKRVSAPGLKATASISWSCAWRDDVGAFWRVSQLGGSA